MKLKKDAINGTSMVDDLAKFRKARKLFFGPRKQCRRHAMKLWRRCCIALAFLAAAGPVSAQPAAPSLKITGGTISGAVIDGEGVFRNIPYAAPPLRDLPWREPQAVVPWTGTRDGRAFGLACMQPNAPDTSEDCLTLNIWTPECPAASKHAVMVWRHGGAPNNVTLFGESAGAEDVGLLLVSPLAKALFHRAIAESGPLRKIYPTLKQQENDCIGVPGALDAPRERQIAFLRGLRAADVLNVAWINQEICRPVNLDGYVLTDQPLKLYAQGAQHPVPFMLGNTLREGFIPMPPTALGQTIRMQYGSRANRVFDAYGFDGRRMPPPDPVYGDVGVQYGTDQAHRCRVMLTGLQHAQTGQPFYQFQFSHDIPGQTNGSTHTDEIPFVFGAPALNALRLARAPELHLSEQMQSYWSNFARTGDPNGAGPPRWPRFEAKAMAYMSFTAQGAAAGEGLRRPQCELFLEQERERPTWQ